MRSAINIQNFNFGKDRKTEEREGDREREMQKIDKQFRKVKNAKPVR